MSKRKKNDKWTDFKNKQSKKRGGKQDDGPGSLEHITVQRLSASVVGKCQKYSRIGALVMVPIDGELTLANIKTACKKKFGVEGMECDLLAGERGPSYTDVSHITDWKVIYVRFIPSSIELDMADSDVGTTNMVDSYVSHVLKPKSVEASPVKLPIATSKIAASVPLSAMLKLGKLIQPKTKVVQVELEQFHLKKSEWMTPFEIKLSLAKEKFASGAFRDAYVATVISGTGLLRGDKYVLKRVREERVKEVQDLFNSIEDHTRKLVQMNALARNFAMKLTAETPADFGKTFTYNKVYFGKLNGEFITLESFLYGTFEKHINNTGDICGNGSEVSIKAETFVHYSYIASGKQLLVVDIQGVEFALCDPEIASSQLVTSDDTILFCSGNLSTEAIQQFFKHHSCNKYCQLLGLEQIAIEDTDK